MSDLRTVSTTRDLPLFKKISCHLVALLKDNAIVNVSLKFGAILLRVSFTYQRPTCMYDNPQILLYLVFELNKKILETSKTPCSIHIALCNVSSMLAHIPQILHHMHCPSFLLGSKYNINNLPFLTILKFLLDNNVLRVSDFCEGLVPILLITSLSKDKVPSVEKPYAYFIFYRNVNPRSNL